MDLSPPATGSLPEPELFYVLGSDGCLAQLSADWKSCLGYELSELRGQSCLNFLHPDDQTIFQSWLETGRRQEPLPPLTLRFRQRQGSYQPLNWKGAWDSQSEAWIGSARPISTSSYPLNIGIPSETIPSTQQRYLATLVEIQQRLLNLKSTNQQQIYSVMLEPLARACGASRVYIFENHRDPQEPERLLLSQKAEWCQAGIPPQIDNPLLQNLPYDAFAPHWLPKLAAGEPICGLVRELGEAERYFLEPQGILSILLLPLFVEEQFFGLIGFDHCQQPYLWSEAEIHLLRAAATSLALTLERQQAESRLSHNQRQWEAERQETTTALQESQNLFRAMFRQAAIGIGVADPQGRLLAHNEAYISMLGYTSEELNQLTFMDFTHPEDLEKDVTLNRELLEGKRDSFRIEKRYVRKGGDPLWVDITVSLVRDAAGQPQFTFSMVQDIHERKRVEQELQLLQSLTQAISEAADFQSALQVMLRQVCVVTGWDLGEAWIPQGEHLVRGATWYKRIETLLLFHRGSAAYRFGLGEGLPGQMWLERRSVWHEDVTQLSSTEFRRGELAQQAGLRACFGVPILADEEVVAVLVFYLVRARPQEQRLVNLVKAAATQLGSIMQRKQAEEALRQAEEKYRSIYENSLEGIFQTTPAGNYLSANPALARIYGYDSPEELIRELTDIEHRLYVDPRRRHVFVQELETVGSISRFESQVYRKDGSIIWISENARAVRDPQGQILYYEGFVEDITERKKVEQALQESEIRYRSLFENTPIGVYRTTPEGKTILANPAIIRMMNCTSYEEMMAWNLEEESHYPPDFSRADFKRQLESAGEIRGLEIEYFRRDGSRITVRENARVVRDESGQVLYYEGTFEDITERKKAEQELQRSLSLLQATLDSTADGILAFDLKGQVLSYNQRFLDLWGLTYAELMSLSPSQRLRRMARRTRHPLRFLRRIRHHLRLQQEGYDLVELKDGRVFECYSKPRQLGETAVNPTQISGCVWSHRDITERKKVERLKNEFVSTVSHELRTPLTSIRGALGLIKGGASGELPPQVQSLVEIAFKNSERLVMLINDILDIEKIESGKMHFDIHPVELMALLQQAIEANRAYAAQFEVDLVLEPTLRSTTGIPLTAVQVNVDPNRLMQVMNNLLSNAAKFSPAGQTVRVWVEQVQEGIRVCVQDRGPGIPEAFRSRIFQKFAQADSSDTRQKGGTGLGLSISKAIVERFGGTIGFESNPAQEAREPTQQGTTFYFTLPGWQPRLASTSPEPADPEPADGVPILVCEDDPDIAMLLQLILKQGGFQVDIASTAADAKYLLQQRPYAAMTLDLSLPDQDGLSLVKDLQQMQGLGNLPIVVVSATAEQRRQAEWLKYSSELHEGSVPPAPPLAGLRPGKAEALSSVIAEHPAKLIAWLNKPINQGQLVAAVQQAAALEERSRPQILHVEDDPDILQVVAQILQNTAELAHAHSLEEARQLLQTRQFQLVILDLYLPDGSGLELLPLLRSVSTTPVVVFSAQDIGSDILEDGIQATLVKARTSNQEFLNTIRALVGGETARRSTHPMGYPPSGGG
ncbi:PAS domain S-box protein [Synechococcus sp. Nb3U1]|uniref:PAS domain S-box protein n=1 Tax=Synechococcus sp. Nb3U1 TaxID=1914529 RepID=UPI001F32DAB2|nr:PAS domain S-box protein [Synechococcus sp. Nb3U1]MCF2971670.1 PAS domain S-box protein [Synechococcus sp. Nb3U1]